FETPKIFRGPNSKAIDYIHRTVLILNQSLPPPNYILNLIGKIEIYATPKNTNNRNMNILDSSISDTVTSETQERRDNSLLSALSSYLLSPYSSNYESSRSAPTEEEIECTMCTVDCVKACHLDDIFADIRPILFGHITDILKESQNNSILLVERTVVALLRLCIRLTHKDEMVFDILLALELLATLPHDVINSV
ncbi:5076_t:CDS:2, partial [Entrophospora sp. SA101]